MSLCRHEGPGASCRACAPRCEPDARCGRCADCLDAIGELGLGDDVAIALDESSKVQATLAERLVQLEALVRGLAAEIRDLRFGADIACSHREELEARIVALEGRKQ